MLNETLQVGPMPCAGMSDTVMVVHMVVSAVPAVLTLFLAQRRVRKDRDDKRRWSNNEEQHVEVLHEVRKTKGKSPNDDLPF